MSVVGGGVLREMKMTHEGVAHDRVKEARDWFPPAKNQTVAVSEHQRTSIRFVFG